MTTESIWDNQPLLKDMEEIRNRLQRKRKGNRLSFNCIFLRWKDDRAFCGKGYMFPHTNDGSMALIAALRGATPSVCKDCGDYEEDE